MTLIAAVAISPMAWSQPTPGRPAGAGGPLTHEDSLVLVEAGVVPAPHYSRADSLAITDSLVRVDSILHSRIRTLPLPSAVDAVLKDFPNNLRNISGELVMAQGEFENYASIVQLPGSEECVVTRYHSADDTTASWQAKMYSSDEFDKASKKYKDLFRQLKACYLKLVDGSIIYLNGDWEPAKESSAFTTSTLRLTTGDWRYRDVKVELELVYRLADWAVNINIVSKKRDDEVGGKGVIVDNQ